MSENLEPNYETEKNLCTQFIEEFSENGIIKYMVQLESLLSGANGSEFEICLDDLKGFNSDMLYCDLLRNIKRNTRRYLNIFSEVIDELVEQRNSIVLEENLRH